jgi:hypothetical protein
MGEVVHRIEGFDRKTSRKKHLEDDRRTSEHNIRMDLDQWDSV